MRIATFLLVAALLAGCDGRSILAVTIASKPGATSALRVRARPADCDTAIGTLMTNCSQLWELVVDKNLQTFGVRLPDDLPAIADITIDAVDPSGCALSRGTVDETLLDKSRIDVRFDLAATAFAQARCPIAFSVSGDGSISDSHGYVCVGCALAIKEYDRGDAVQLQAQPDLSSQFSAWTGGTCQGTNPTCSATIATAATIKASFTIKN